MAVSSVGSTFPVHFSTGDRIGKAVCTAGCSRSAAPIFAGSRVVSAPGLPGTSRPGSVTQLGVTEGRFDLEGEFEPERASDRGKAHIQDKPVSSPFGSEHRDSGHASSVPETSKLKPRKRNATSANDLTLGRPRNLKRVE